MDDFYQDLFYNPEKYNLLQFTNTWSADSEPPGPFIPAYQTFDKFLVGIDPFKLDEEDPPKMFISRIQVDKYGNPVATYTSRPISDHYPLR